MNQETIFKKLRLDDSKKLLIVNAPADYLAIIKGSLNYDEEPQEPSYDFVQVFAISQADLEKSVMNVGKYAKYDCLFWACYPKGTGSIKSNIKRETVWKAFDLIGLQAVSQIAIDDTWSALRARPIEAVGK